jgi:hypothetical protein
MAALCVMVRGKSGGHGLRLVELTGDPENNDKHDYFFSAIPKKEIFE